MPTVREKKQLMSASEIDRTLVRLAHEIVEKNNGVENLGLVGIRRRGVPLANRLAKILGRIEKTEVPVGTLDIALYRDDLSTSGHRPTVTKGDIGFDVTGRDVVLMDDVLYTGRTIRAALDALFDHGRPKSVQLLVLIDRGHRELPIRPDYVGKNLPTSRQQRVNVHVTELDGVDEITVGPAAHRFEMIGDRAR